MFHELAHQLRRSVTRTSAIQTGRHAHRQRQHAAEAHAAQALGHGLTVRTIAR